jgi:hypothetical protein
VEEKIPQSAIDAIAQQINQRTNKQYNIPIVGDISNPETPQIYEIIPFDQIDKSDLKFYAIDGSSNGHSFYNGISVGIYRGGYVCFHEGKQIRLNNHDDPVIMGQSYTPQNILITCDEHLFSIYDELLSLPPVKKFMEFLGDSPKEVFPIDREHQCRTSADLLSFCQDVLEWSLIYEVACRAEIKPSVSTLG